VNGWIENEFGERFPINDEAERKTIIQMGNDLVDRDREIVELKRLITALPVTPGCDCAQCAAIRLAQETPLSGLGGVGDSSKGGDSQNKLEAP
jgi:hypothetical protein